jgi:hypothetical protein
LDHFREWLLIADRCCRLSSNENIELEKVFNLISYELSSLPRVWVHRDFQSRNIMIKNVTSDSHSIHVIDFQDALMGPPIYDLVALLRDSYVDLGLELVNRLIQFYLHHFPQPIFSFDFYRAFHLQTIQRKLKDAGRFIYIDRVKNNSNFLKYIPNSLKYVSEALPFFPEFQTLAEILANYLPDFQRA